MLSGLKILAGLSDFPGSSPPLSLPSCSDENIYLYKAPQMPKQ